MSFGAKLCARKSKEMKHRIHPPQFFHARWLAVLMAVLASFLLSPAAAALFPFDEGEAASPSLEAWRWPSGEPVAITHAFDPPSQDWLSGHRGVDLNIPVGATIYAPAAGTVTFAGRLVDRQVLVIEHDHRRSTFEPVAPLVSLGDHVEEGQAIGIVEAGHSPGPLHWGVKVGAKQYLNPLRQLLAPIVLKPW